MWHDKRSILVNVAVEDYQSPFCCLLSRFYWALFQPGLLLLIILAYQSSYPCLILPAISNTSYSPTCHLPVSLQSLHFNCLSILHHFSALFYLFRSTFCCLYDLLSSILFISPLSVPGVGPPVFLLFPHCHIIRSPGGISWARKSLLWGGGGSGYCCISRSDGAGKRGKKLTRNNNGSKSLAILR